MFSSNMNFRTLTIVTDVLKSLNFTDVARTHGITQPAVSLQVNKFEDIVGIDLIKRVGNRMVLTEAGKQALQLGESVLKMLEDMGRIRLSPADRREAIGVAPDLAVILQEKGGDTASLLQGRYAVIDTSWSLKARFEAREVQVVARLLFDYEEHGGNAVAMPFAWARYGNESGSPRPDDVLFVDMPCLSSPIGEAALKYLNASKVRYKVVREWAEGLYPDFAASAGEPLSHVPVPLFRMAELGVSRATVPSLQDDIIVHAGLFSAVEEIDRGLLQRLGTSTATGTGL